MSAINSIITKLFDIMLAPAAVSPWLGMALISCITGFVLLLVYRYTSNQRGIQAAKDRITAHLLEIVLYRDAMRVVMRGEARVLRNILSYLGYTIIPLACMLIPVALLFAQIELRYGSRPLQVGERAIISMKMGGNTDLSKISLSAPSGIVVETESLRMPQAKEVDWRVKAGEVGRYRLEMNVEGKKYTKDLVVGPAAGRISTRRIASVWEQFLYPGEALLPAEAGVSSIEVAYPAASLPLGKWEFYWLWPWLVLSMIFGLIFKGPLRVQV